MSEFKCSKCGKDARLIMRDGQLLCRKCYSALPRARCRAMITQGPYAGRRCGRTVIGGTLCEHHKDQPELTWEKCPRCRLEKAVGYDCPWCLARDKRREELI